LFSYHSITGYHQDILQQKVSCEEAVLHYLQQITLQQPLNAFVNVYAGEALQKARSLDAFRKSNPDIPLKKLHGVVVSIKDVIAYKNHPLTAGSKMLHGFSSIYNATVVDRLLNEDAIIIGHNNCDEFAMGSSNENPFYGSVKNALDHSKVPGGSSGGSAVAVQAGLCMVSIGSDTGGSVRQPADFCGIVGFKPTYGSISRYGLVAYASSFDQIGILSNTVEDASCVLDVIAGPDEHDTTLFANPFEPEAGSRTIKKIAYFKDAVNHPSLDPEIRTAFDHKLLLLQQSGHTVEALDFPLLEYLVPTYYILTTAEASSNLNRYDGVKFGYRTSNMYPDLNTFYKTNRSEGFGKEVQKRIMLGTFVLSSGYYDAYFTKAQQVRNLLTDFISKHFTSFDFILMPNVPGTAPFIGDKEKDPIAVYLADIYTVLANLTGIPSVSVPLSKHSNGMPIGLQILADKKQDAALLGFAKTC
jgi:aspartyl-tRNA(Asn)/glutamyl-tRNA(Gln) amidotransferase subunit A